MQKTIQAGALVRRDVRRFLLSHDIDFTEDKGFLDSMFYLKCSDNVYKNIMNILTNTQ